MTIKQKYAKLRVCGSCEWIFRNERHHETGGCPKCGWAHYGARFVYGGKAYGYAKSQKPWFDKKIAEYSSRLQHEIQKARFRGEA